jgi:hypothetical protein
MMSLADESATKFAHFFMDVDMRTLLWQTNLSV